MLLLVPVPLATLTACGSGNGDAPADTAPTSTGAASARPFPGSGTARALVDTADPRLVADDLAVPWGLAFLPDGAALVAERDTGRILRLPAGGGEPSEVGRIAEVETDPGEGGLLGLAVSPAFGTDRLVYAYYTTERDNRIARFRLEASPDGTGTSAGAGAGAGIAVDPILTGLAAARIHNGGRIAFGPDGMLYAGVGDAGNRASAQDPRKLNGKILRMRPDGSVPAGNPVPDSLVYSLGHRNVQGLAWDDAGNLWATEFGQNAFDEVNLIRPGANYGWPAVEGLGGTDGGRFTNPLVVWDTGEASPSGAAILGGVLYVAALRGERLWAVPLDGEKTGEPQALLTGTLGRLRTVAAAPDGSLWVTTSNTDGRGSPRNGDDRIVALR